MGRQIGPGMIQQLQRPCEECDGRGSKAKTKSERKVLEVHIEPGAHGNHRISFKGMADEIPKMETGDINFIVQEKEHDTFKRKGADLLVTKELSLNQALCGFAHHLTHLDGRKIVIKTRPGEVIKPETLNNMPYVKMVPNEVCPAEAIPSSRAIFTFCSRSYSPTMEIWGLRPLPLLDRSYPILIWRWNTMPRRLRSSI